MSPVSPAFHTVEKVRLPFIKKKKTCLLSFVWENTKLGKYEVRITVDLIHTKWRAEIGPLRSCSVADH